MSSILFADWDSGRGGYSDASNIGTTQRFAFDHVVYFTTLLLVEVSFNLMTSFLLCLHDLCLNANVFITLLSEKESKYLSGYFRRVHMESNNNNDWRDRKSN